MQEGSNNEFAKHISTLDTYLKEPLELVNDATREPLTR